VNAERALVSLPVCLALFLPACFPDIPPLTTCDVERIRTESLPDGVVGQPYSFRLEHNCPPLSNFFAQWRASGSLPPGMRLSGSGELSGPPTLAGDFSLAVSLLEFDGGPVLESKTFSLVIRPAP
jgi:large repetitive protein